MKKALQKITYLSVIVTVMFFVGTVARAATDYTPLQPLPDIGEGTPTTNLTTYIPAAFNLAIVMAAVLAFVMITLGGITYATTDAVSGKAEGKERITNAVWGLLLVIGAYAILYTINPKILQFDLTFKTPKVETNMVAALRGSVLPGYTLNPAQVADDSSVRALLSTPSINITVNHPACANGQVSNCTNLNDLPDSALQGVQWVKSSCGGCYFQITGGTEGGHLAHGPG